MSTKKSAPHRKAIAEAASLSPTDPAMKTQTKPGSRTTGSHNNNATSSDHTSSSLTPTENNDDYETSKVGKAKKATYDADVKAVQDLDRWG